MIKRILVGLAGSKHTEAKVREAAAIAKLHDAVLSGVTIVDLERLEHTGAVPLGAGHSAVELAEYRVEQARKQSIHAAEVFRKVCQQEDVPHRLQSETGNPFELLISHWRYHDLTIIGLRSLFEFGLVDEPEDSMQQLIRKNVRPVLSLYRRMTQPIQALVAYNGSMESAKAMKRFVQMRLWPDMEFRVVCFKGDEYTGEAEQLVEDASAYIRVHGFQAEGAVREGHPREQVHEEADRFDADIIVAGNSQRRLILRKVFGDTTLSLIRNAERSLFLTQ